MKLPFYCLKRSKIGSFIKLNHVKSDIIRNFINLSCGLSILLDTYFNYMLAHYTVLQDDIILILTYPGEKLRNFMTYSWLFCSVLDLCPSHHAVFS